MSKLDKSFYNVEKGIREVQEHMLERLEELSLIAKEKGINDFGWKNGEPIQEDDDEAYEDFNNSQISIIIIGDDYAYQTRELLMTRFMFDDRDLICTEYYNDDECELCRDLHIPFNIISDYNWQAGYRIMKMIEEELGVKTD